MRSNYVPFPKRNVSLMAVFLVVLLLLTVCGTAHANILWFEKGPIVVKPEQYAQRNYSDFHSMTEEQKQNLAEHLLKLNAEDFNASLDAYVSRWSEEQLQEFTYWLGTAGILSSPVDIQTGQLSTTFHLPGRAQWPVNIPKPKQGCLSQSSQGNNTQSFVIQGTTRTTYDELKARVEAGEWALNDRKGKKQVDKDVKNNLGPNAKTPEEYYEGLGVTMEDEAYYSRADGQGSLGLAFGGNTTMLFVTQKTPGNAVEEPFPTLYSSKMTAAQKKALVLTLLNMGKEDLIKAIHENLAALTTDEFEEFMAYFDNVLRALGDDVYNDFYSWLMPVTGE